MNILFFLTPKSDVAYIFEDETLRQTVEKMEHRKFSCIPLLSMDARDTVGRMFPVTAQRLAIKQRSTQEKLLQQPQLT